LLYPLTFSCRRVRCVLRPKHGARSPLVDQFVDLSAEHARRPIRGASRNASSRYLANRSGLILCSHWWVDGAVCHPGCSYQILFFLALNYAELTKLLGIKLNMSTACHPQSDGESERRICSLTIALRASCNENQDYWDDHLDMLELGFNCAVQASTQRSPYKLMYGLRPRLPIDAALMTIVPRSPPPSTVLTA
jgi:hypothetical protein